MKSTISLCAAWLLLSFPLAIAQTPEAGTGDETAPSGDRFNAARSILTERCLRCHGGQHRKSELSFASHGTFSEGGSRGPVLKADDLQHSRLLDVIEYDNPELAMPPSGALHEGEVATLREWILAGAPWPKGEAGQLADPLLHPLEEHHVVADASWWAYGPLDNQPAPAAEAAAWDEHPVDRWIHAGAIDQELVPSAERASPAVLLRRASYNLTGLPPTEIERRAFLASVQDNGWDQAWSELLDRLFASPHYGEAQARHWLDLVRYAETDGYERDSKKENIWRYRDWIIRAFDRDLPYDRFIQLQLAGDEYALDLEDPHEISDAHLATGFYRVALFDDEPADPAQAASDERADIVDTVSQVVFGTTMGCARCHDHKADPVTQRDYFTLTAHFAGVTRYSKEGTRLFADRPTEGDVPASPRIQPEADAPVEPKALETAPLTLVADATAGGHEWRYRTADVFPTDDSWPTPAYDDAAWQSGRSGFGTPKTLGALVETPWSDRVIHLRTTFRLESIPEALLLTIQHDDDARIYINGQLVLKRGGYITEYRGFQLGQSALDTLVVGRNVLAVECHGTGGGQSIDVGISTAWDPGAEGAAELAAAAASGAYPAHVVYEKGPTAPAQFVELRGSVHARGEEVEPALPAAWLVGQAPDAPAYAVPAAPEGSASSLRRRALADWAFSDGSHITSRVAANRIWQFLFGRGLCRSSGDFGRLGELPTHPELLDRVAVELIQRGWSIKSLQRWLMESEAYQMSATAGADAAAIDGRNDHYTHFDPRRLTAEEFRDATLLASGELNPTRFGPWVFPPLAKEVLATSSKPGSAWGKSSPADAVRRSLYVHVKRSLREPLLAALDQPDPDLPCAVRFPTNVPTQALLTLNGPFVNTRAAALANEVLGDKGSMQAALKAAIERCLARTSTDDEIQRGLAFVTALQTEHQMAAADAMKLYALGLFNRNEFLWID